MTGVPPDFGGFLGYWHEGKAVLTRYGQGKPLEGVVFTPLNLLQARKLIDDLIAQGEAQEMITDEHRRQAGLMPTSMGLDKIMPRDDVDRIAGQG